MTVAKHKKVTLESVNDQLLERLSSLIDDAGPDQILDLTESLAKLNSSYKGNQSFSKPESDDERIAREQADALKEALRPQSSDIQEGEII